MQFLTICWGEVTVCRARLAPEMISTPGHRDLRRRQRRTLPVWLHSGEPKWGCAVASASSNLTADAGIHPPVSDGGCSRCQTRSPPRSRPWNDGRPGDNGRHWRWSQDAAVTP
jgi:hypothetical protein